jgi:ferredoxin
MMTREPTSLIATERPGSSPEFAYRIRVADGSVELSSSPDQTVLAAFERFARAAIQVGCRSGGCGVCRVQVLEGQVRAEKMSLRHVNPAQRAAGYALACRIYPASDLIIAVAPRSACPGARMDQ